MGMGTGGILYPSTLWVWVWYCSTLPIPYPLPSLVRDNDGHQHYVGSAYSLRYLSRIWETDATVRDTRAQRRGEEHRVLGLPSTGSVLYLFLIKTCMPAIV
jgi:hypothetical protein